MLELSMKILCANGITKCVSRGMDEVHLVAALEYEEGDRIVIEASESKQYLVVQVDDALTPALIYLKKNSLEFKIPFGEKRNSYSPKVFYGNRHYLYARLATKGEVSAYRNLALNPMDQNLTEQNEEAEYYPHARANVETRGEAVFAARNAIDGIRENRSHGEWPYGSWGINRRPDASFTLEFGREVLVDQIVLYTRSDFPHDNWWKQVTFIFSDGTSLDFPMEKSEQPHRLTFEKKRIHSLTMEKLIASSDPSPFPALSQIEVYGTEVIDENEEYHET